MNLNKKKLLKFGKNVNIQFKYKYNILYYLFYFIILIYDIKKHHIILKLLIKNCLQKYRI